MTNINPATIQNLGGGGILAGAQDVPAGATFLRALGIAMTPWAQKKLKEQEHRYKMEELAVPYQMKMPLQEAEIRTNAALAAKYLADAKLKLGDYEYYYGDTNARTPGPSIAARASGMTANIANNLRDIVRAYTSLEGEEKAIDTERAERFREILRGTNETLKAVVVRRLRDEYGINDWEKWLRKSSTADDYDGLERYPSGRSGRGYHHKQRGATGSW